MTKDAKVTSRHLIPFGLMLGSVLDGNGETMKGEAKVYVVEDCENVHLAVFQFQDMSVMLELGDLMSICTRSDTWKRVEECMRD